MVSHLDVFLAVGLYPGLSCAELVKKMGRKQVTYSSVYKLLKKLTEEKLEELGIPSYVDIVIPTPENSLLPDEDDYPCFLEVSRYLGYRRLDLVNFQGRVVQLLCFSPPQEEKIGFLIYKPLGS